MVEPIRKIKDPTNKICTGNIFNDISNLQGGEGRNQSRSSSQEIQLTDMKHVFGMIEQIKSNVDGVRNLFIDGKITTFRKLHGHLEKIVMEVSRSRSCDGKRPVKEETGVPRRMEPAAPDTAANQASPEKITSDWKNFLPHLKGSPPVLAPKYLIKQKSKSINFKRVSSLQEQQPNKEKREVEVEVVKQKTEVREEETKEKGVAQGSPASPAQTSDTQYREYTSMQHNEKSAQSKPDGKKPKLIKRRRRIQPIQALSNGEQVSKKLKGEESKELDTAQDLHLDIYPELAKISRDILARFWSLVPPNHNRIQYFLQILRDVHSMKGGGTFNRVFKTLIKDHKKCDICLKPFHKSAVRGHMRLCDPRQLNYMFPQTMAENVPFCPIGPQCPQFEPMLDQSSEFYHKDLAVKVFRHIVQEHEADKAMKWGFNYELINQFVKEQDLVQGSPETSTMLYPAPAPKTVGPTTSQSLLNIDSNVEEDDSSPPFPPPTTVKENTENFRENSILMNKGEQTMGTLVNSNAPIDGATARNNSLLIGSQLDNTEEAKGSQISPGNRSVTVDNIPAIVPQHTLHPSAALPNLDLSSMRLNSHNQDHLLLNLPSNLQVLSNHNMAEHISSSSDSLDDNQQMTVKSIFNSRDTAHFSNEKDLLHSQYRKQKREASPLEEEGEGEEEEGEINQKTPTPEYITDDNNIAAEAAMKQ